MHLHLVCPPATTMLESWRLPQRPAQICHACLMSIRTCLANAVIKFEVALVEDIAPPRVARGAFLLPHEACRIALLLALRRGGGAGVRHGGLLLVGGLLCSDLGFLMDLRCGVEACIPVHSGATWMKCLRILSLPPADDWDCGAPCGHLFNLIGSSCTCSLP